MKDGMKDFKELGTRYTEWGKGECTNIGRLNFALILYTLHELSHDEDIKKGLNTISDRIFPGHSL